MYGFDLIKLNRTLIGSIKLVGACQRLLGPKSDVKDHLGDLNRELREAASECQRVLKLIERDNGRLLLDQEEFKP